MISLTIIPEKTNTHKPKNFVGHQENKPEPRVRFSSLKLIEKPSENISKIVPLEFTSQISNIQRPLRETYASRVELIAKHSHQQKASCKANSQKILFPFETYSSQKKMPFFDDLDNELNLFKPKKESIEEDYLRVCYQKLALESYLHNLGQKAKSKSTQAGAAGSH